MSERMTDALLAELDNAWLDGSWECDLLEALKAERAQVEELQARLDAADKKLRDIQATIATFNIV